MNMNALHVSQADAAVSSRAARWKKLGIGMVLAFTLKGLITTSLLVITLLEFIRG